MKMLKKKIYLVSIFIILLVISCSLSFNSYAESEDTSTKSAESDSLSKESIDKKEIPDDAKVQELSAGALGVEPPTEEVFEGGIGKGALLSPLLGESFQIDLATGSATVSVPIVVPPGRKNMQPSLALSYSSNNANGICGVGWGLTTSAIQRSTKKGVPKYDSTDTFIFSSSGSSGELVEIATNEYRQKIETAFMKYIYDDVSSKWDVWDKNGIKYTFGSVADSRIVNTDVSGIFAWYLDKVEDVYGNAVVYTYQNLSNMRVDLLQIEYTQNDKATPALGTDKKILFLYKDRPDIVYSYRSGHKMTIPRLLDGIQILVDEFMEYQYKLTYTQSTDTGRSILTEVKVLDSQQNSLPPKKFTYQTID